MTGKSKWTDETQKNVIKSMLFLRASYEDIKVQLNPVPSKRTVERWEDKWVRIIEEEKLAEEINARQDKQDEARRRQLRQDKKKVRQDEKSTFSIPIRFLSDVEEALNTHLSAYNKSKYGAAVRRRERIHTILEIIKEVDK